MRVMISGSHMILYSSDAEADRAFFRDVLQFPSVDAGRGWLIFALPPAEVAFHPANAPEAGRHEMFLMTADLQTTLNTLESRNVPVEPVTEERWGSLTRIQLPGGGKLGLYQPKHPIAAGLNQAPNKA